MARPLWAFPIWRGEITGIFVFMWRIYQEGWDKSCPTPKKSGINFLCNTRVLAKRWPHGCGSLDGFGTGCEFARGELGNAIIEAFEKTPAAAGLRQRMELGGAFQFSE